MAPSRVPSNSVDHVGSLKRPAELVAAWRAWEAGKLAPKNCVRRKIEPSAMRSRCRRIWACRLLPTASFAAAAGRAAFSVRSKASTSVPRSSFSETTMDLRRRRRRRSRPRKCAAPGQSSPRTSSSSTRLRSRSAKVTMPTPSHMHFGHFKDAVDPTVYPHVEAYWDDMVAVFQQEINELYAAGCRYLQLDEVPLALLCDKNIRALAKSEGDDPDKLVGLYIDVLNRAIAGRPADLTIGMHLCRGNMEAVEGEAATPRSPRLYSSAPMSIHFCSSTTRGGPEISRHCVICRRISVPISASSVPKTRRSNLPTT